MAAREAPALTRRYRVAMVAACPFPAARGTPVRIQRMAEAIAARGHEVHVVAYHMGGPLRDPPYRLHRATRLPTYTKFSPGPSAQKLLLMDPLLARCLRGVIRRERIDLVHAHHYEGLLAARVAAVGLELPIIYDAHTMLQTELGHYFPWVLRRTMARLGASLDHRLPRHASHVIAISRSIKARLVEAGLPAERVTIIGNGVEQDHFEPAEGVHLADATKRLVFTGNLAPYQGIELLLQSFRIVLRSHPDARLTIVTSSSFAHYEPLAAALGIRGALEVVPASFAELPHRLAVSGIALNPRTRCDGMPLKLLNYMAAARPIVSFAGSAHGMEDGVTALLVPDGDTAAFAAAIVRLIEDPDLARCLGERAHDVCRERHSWTHTAARVEKVYDRLMGGATSAV